MNYFRKFPGQRTASAFIDAGINKLKKVANSRIGGGGGSSGGGRQEPPKVSRLLKSSKHFVFFNKKTLAGIQGNEKDVVELTDSNFEELVQRQHVARRVLRALVRPLQESRAALGVGCYGAHRQSQGSVTFYFIGPENIF